MPDTKLIARVNLSQDRSPAERVTDLSDSFFDIVRLIHPGELQLALERTMTRVYLDVARAPSKDEFTGLCAAAYDRHLRELSLSTMVRQ